MEKAPFRMLRGRPFQRATLCRLEDLPNGEVEVSIRDPADLARHIYVPARPRKAHVGCLRVLSVLTSNNPRVYIDPSLQLNHFPTPALAYKKVARKVRPVRPLTDR